MRNRHADRLLSPSGLNGGLFAFPVRYTLARTVDWRVVILTGRCEPARSPPATEMQEGIRFGVMGINVVDFRVWSHRQRRYIEVLLPQDPASSSPSPNIRLLPKQPSINQPLITAITVSTTQPPKLHTSTSTPKHHINTTMSAQKIYIPNLVGLQILALDLDEPAMPKQPSGAPVNHNQPDSTPAGPWTHKPFDYIPEDAF